MNQSSITHRPGKVSSWLLPIAIILVLGALVFMRGKFAPTVAHIPDYFDKSLTLASAMTTSAENGKPVVALATADWCGPCQSLKRNALSDPKVAAFLRDKTIPVYLDTTNTIPSDAEYLNIQGFPTMIVFKNGKEVGRFMGAQPTDNVLAFLEQSAQ